MLARGVREGVSADLGEGNLGEGLAGKKQNGKQSGDTKDFEAARAFKLIDLGKGVLREVNCRTNDTRLQTTALRNRQQRRALEPLAERKVATGAYIDR